MDVLKTLREWAEAMHIKSIVMDVFRDIGWFFIKIMATLCDEVNKAVEQIYNLLGFAKYGPFQKFVDDLYPIVVILLVLSIMLLGYYLIVKRADAQLSIFQNIVLIILVLTIMPVFTTKMATLTTTSSDYARHEYMKGNSAAFRIIDNNIVDMLYVDSLTGANSFSKYSLVETANGEKTNKIGSMAKVRTLDITAYMNYDEDALVHEELWKSRLTEDSKGKYTTGEMDQSWLDVFHDYYYRYHVNWWTVILSLLAMTLTLLFTCFRAGRLVIEVAMHTVIGPFIAVTDLASGQRIKEFIKSFIGLFAVLFLISCLLGVYFLGMQFLSSQHSKGNINDFVYVLMQIALCLAVIDGPNVIERIIGIDAGIKSGYQTLIGGLAIARGTRGAAEGVTSAAVGSASKRANGELGGIAGAVKRTGKGLTRVTIGRKGEDALNQKKDGVKEAVRGGIDRATGGYGVAGAVKNAADEVKSIGDERSSARMGEDNLGGIGASQGERNRDLSGLGGAGGARETGGGIQRKGSQGSVQKPPVGGSVSKQTERPAGPRKPPETPSRPSSGKDKKPPWEK